MPLFFQKKKGLHHMWFESLAQTKPTMEIQENDKNKIKNKKCF